MNSIFAITSFVSSDGNISLAEVDGEGIIVKSYYLDFSTNFQSYTYDEEDQTLAVTGSSDKRGDYTVTISVP